MDLNLHQLKIFSTVADHLSFTRAAEQMHLSQSSVSLQVKQLERSLGLELFEQIGKKIYLTESGRTLQEYSQKLFALIDETLLVMDEMKGVMRGAVNVVADTTAGIYVVPQAIGAFHRLHPNIQLSLSVKERTGAQEELLANRADLAIIARVPDSLTFGIQEFMPNELVVIAPPTHRLAGRRHIPVEELSGETIILREVGSMTRDTTERFFRDRGVDVRFGMTLGSTGAIKQAVAADLGIAVLSKQAISLELGMGRLVTLEVDGFPIMRKWFIVHLKEKRLSTAAAALKQFLWDYRQQQAPNLVN
ncbi:MAG TPA: LysR family transcriptional regulator [Chloroflexota bacterium]|nr:LysR family transcriptional regulator [Chloroflexota bacterium]